MPDYIKILSIKENVVLLKLSKGEVQSAHRREV